MKYLHIIIATTILLTAACKQPQPQQIAMNSSLDSMSYSLGVLYAQKLQAASKSNTIDSINQTFFNKGVQDYFDSTATFLLQESEIQAHIQALIQQKKSEYETLVQKQENERIKNQGKEFLEKNKLLAGILELQEGLQYKIIRKGIRTALEKDSITVRFKIYSLANKELYNSATAHPNGMNIAVSNLPKAIQLAVEHMSLHSIFMVYAYYEYNIGLQEICNVSTHKFETLLYEIELLNIINNTQTQVPPPAKAPTQTTDTIEKSKAAIKQSQEKSQVTEAKPAVQKDNLQEKKDSKPKDTTTEIPNEQELKEKKDTIEKNSKFKFIKR